MLSDVCLSDVCRVHRSAGGVCGRRAGWHALADQARLGRPGSRLPLHASVAGLGRGISWHLPAYSLLQIKISKNTGGHVNSVTKLKQLQKVGAVSQNLLLSFFFFSWPIFLEITWAQARSPEDLTKNCWVLPVQGFYRPMWVWGCIVSNILAIFFWSDQAVIYVNFFLLLPCVPTLTLLTYKHYTSYCLKENQCRSYELQRDDVNINSVYTRVVR